MNPLTPIAAFFAGAAGLLAQGPAPVSAESSSSRDVPIYVEDVLIVEKRKERAARNRVARELARYRVTLAAEDLSARELARYLTVATGNRVDFVPIGQSVAVDDLPTLTLQLSKHPALQTLSIIQSVTDLRFVFGSGVVMIKHKDDVREDKRMKVYDLRSAVATLRDFPGPKIGINVDDEGLSDLEDQDPDKTVSGFTIEGIHDMVREHVEPDSWDAEGGSTISIHGGALIVRASDRTHTKVGQFLVQIGVVPPPTRVRRPRR